MYNNSYFNPQLSIDRINNQIAELEKIRSQLQQPQPQPTNLTQNFQITPTNSHEVMRYANSLDEVKKYMIITDTPFFSRDMSILWLKNAKGDVKTYELKEIIEKDEKDVKIEFLMAQVEELKKGLKEYEPKTNTNESVRESNENEEPSNVSTISKSSKKSK